MPVYQRIAHDADDDDAVALTAELHARVQAARSDVLSSIMVAVREYEAWFLAAAESLRGHRGLPADLAAPPDPEAIRDTKGWLRGHMPGGRKYAETSDQAASLDARDLLQEVERYLRAVRRIAVPAALV